MLRNLAGHINPDFAIEEELRRCRIGAIRGERSAGEVGASITGWLGPFTFRRAWRYWVAEGRVPLHVAEELYADPVGITDVRAGGDCACRPPEVWAEWYDEVDGNDTATGKKLVPMSEKAKCDVFAASMPSFRESMAAYLFVDDPKSYGVGYVTTYHIDSEIGLRLFADTLRKHGLHETSAFEEVSAC